MVLPSRREGYGLVVVEACAAGTPCVVVADPDNAAIELIEEGVNGFVAPSASPEDLAAAITRVRDGRPGAAGVDRRVVRGERAAAVAGGVARAGRGGVPVMTLVSAIVVTQRGGPLLDACLASLRTALSPLDAEILVVDNSTEGVASERSPAGRGRAGRPRAAAGPERRLRGRRRRRARGGGRASGSCSSTTTRSSSRALPWRCSARRGPPRWARPAARSASTPAATRSTRPGW